MKWRKFIALIGGLVIAWPLASYAQQPKQPIKHVALLSQLPCALMPKTIVRRLGQFGWIEGQTITFDCESTVGRVDQVPALARELVSRRPDVLITFPYSYVIALKQETTTIPIIMLGTGEPVRLGLVANLARPGGNVTGVAWFDLLSKRMELLKEIVPNLRRVAWLGSASDLANATPEGLKVAEEDRQIVASALGFTGQIFRPAVENDYDEIFARLATEHFDAVDIIWAPYNIQNATRICQLVLRHRIPAVSAFDTWAKCEFLLIYGQDVSWTHARDAEYIDKILRGAKPSDLPVEQATKLRLTINLKTAKELGLTVPPSLIARADEVIE
jgi:putative tryptophan/tyrosine transport system substrate-binding protein